MEAPCLLRHLQIILLALSFTTPRFKNCLRIESKGSTLAQKQ